MRSLNASLGSGHAAGFPSNLRLLEEPQAAFYRWLEEHPSPEALELPPSGVSHVLVIDIGGGTSDFSLFEMSAQPGSIIPHIKRVAVSDHLLSEVTTSTWRWHTISNSNSPLNFLRRNGISWWRDAVI